MIAMTDGRIDK